MISIGHDLVRRAFVTMDRLHQAFEHRVEDLACFLWFPVGAQFHGALQVGEEHGDLLALSLEGALRRQDLLGQMPRGIGLRGCERGWLLASAAYRTNGGTSCPP
jgi:hypothetical protein